MGVEHGLKFHILCEEEPVCYAVLSVALPEFARTTCTLYTGVASVSPHARIHRVSPSDSVAKPLNYGITTHFVRTTDGPTALWCWGRRPSNRRYEGKVSIGHKVRHLDRHLIEPRET